MQDRATTTDSAFRPGAHIPALDGLRGIAVLVVMVMHFSLLEPAGAVHAAYSRLSGIGWTGVDLFFVLSGFLITGILYDAKGSQYYFRNFYVRRTLRIFPLYYAFLIALFIILPLVVSSWAEPDKGEERLWMWAYLGNVLMARVGWEGLPSHTSHLWSLAVEEQFYLIWPLLVWWASRKRLIAICLGAIALATVVRIALHLAGAGATAGYTLLPARVDALALGGLIAVLARDPAALARLRGAAMPALLVSIAAIVAVILAIGSGGALPPLDFRVQMFAYPAVAVVAGALVVLAIPGGGEGPFSRLLTTRPLLQFGKYSYALYLLHVPIRNVIRSASPQATDAGLVAGSWIPLQVAIIIGGIAVSYLVALASWNLFEKHFLALKRLFPYDASKAPRAARDPEIPADIATLPAPARLATTTSTGQPG